MFVPMWVFYALISIYLSIGVIYVFVGFLSGHGRLTFREFLLCFFLWPLFLLK